MAPIHPGRFTADFEGDFVVFMIGMRVNKVWQVSKWLQTAIAMPTMVRELYQHPDLGFLGAEDFFRFPPLTTCMVSYWRSFEHLEAFARGAEHSHLPAWKRFNQLVGSDGSVGIWHETYLVHADEYETLYGNMPRFGLARAGDHVPATGRRETARRRLGGKNQPAVPSPTNTHAV